MGFEEEIRKLQRSFNLEDYGLKDLLHSPIIYSQDKGFYATLPGISSQKGFDCLTSSIRAQELLKEKGIKSSVFTGSDERNLWQENHTFLKVGNEVIDFTPHYPTIGAKHIEDIELDEMDVAEYDKPYDLSLLWGSFPINQYKNKTQLLGFKIPSWVHPRAGEVPTLEVSLNQMILKNGIWQPIKRVKAKDLANMEGKKLIDVLPKNFIPTQ